LAKSSWTAERGFSILEVLMATTILTVGLAALAQLFAISTRANFSAKTTSTAAILAQQKMEQLRALTWGFDVLGLPLSDYSSDTTVIPEAPTGGKGLTPSPPDVLKSNQDGYCDFLDRYGYPLGYGLCFLAATIFFAVSFVFLALVREPAGPARERPRPITAYLRRLPRLVRADPNLARFLGARALDVVGGMAGGFYTVYALKALGAPDSAVGTFTLALMAAQTVGMLFFGWLADRRGHLSVLTLGALASAAASLAALGADSLAAVYPVFLLYGLSIGAGNVSAMSIGLEFGPAEERPTYVAITNSSRAPFALLGPLVGGALADAAGYGAVFGLAAALALAGAAAMRLAVRDPRGYRRPPAQ